MMILNRIVRVGLQRRWCLTQDLQGGEPDQTKPYWLAIGGSQLFLLGGTRDY